VVKVAVGASRVTIPREPGDGPGPRLWKGRRRLLRSRTTAWTVGLSLLPLGLLAMASWVGRHVRPSADEWCFLPTVRDHGVSGLIAKFYVTDNGRIGNGVLIGLYTKFPVAGHQWFALISGVLMLVLLWALTVQLLRMAN
jgi:hypothetical protein